MLTRNDSTSDSTSILGMMSPDVPVGADMTVSQRHLRFVFVIRAFQRHRRYRRVLGGFDRQSRGISMQRKRNIVRAPSFPVS